VPRPTKSNPNLNPTQCDGERPLCGACVKRHDVECESPVREGAVSRIADLKVTKEIQAREIKGLKELLNWLTSRPASEAAEALAWCRNIVHAVEDPLAVLEFVKNANGIPASLSIYGGIADWELAKIDARALEASGIGLPAQPWTSVAGDRLVSHLISSFFSWDDPCVYTFLDRELFIRDMRCGSQSQTQLCSPFLVNAICALRSVSRSPAFSSPVLVC
jgi:hypothetical protein